MIKQNRVWVQSLTLRHTLAATQRRLRPLHHSQTPHPPTPHPSEAPLAHADPNQHFMTGLTSLTTRWLRLCLYLSVMWVPGEQLVWRFCRRRPPLEASVDGWFLAGGIMPPVCLKTQVVQWIPALQPVLHVDIIPPRTMKYCVTMQYIKR